MNRTIRSILHLLLPMAAVLTAEAQSHLNFVRQTHYDTAVIWDVPIGEAGSMDTPLGIGALGSVLELWSWEPGTDQIVEMDREIISNYNPNIRLAFETGDPYQPVARTRVDQPFTARITVSGMGIFNRQDLAELLATLDIVHQGFVFPSQDYTLDDLGGLNEPVVINQWTVTADGEYVFEFPVTNLTGPDLTKVFGAELMAVTSPGRYNNGHGNNLDGVDGDHKLSDRIDVIVEDELYQNSYIVGNIFEWTMVQIWPIAEASIEGLDPTVIYQEVPPVSINLVDLYPDSTTYVRAYLGPPTATPADPIELGTAAVIVQGSTPQDRTIVIKNLDDHLSEEGAYTLEVLHETPFGTEILTQFYPIQVDWDIDVRGQINTLE